MRLFTRFLKLDGDRKSICLYVPLLNRYVQNSEGFHIFFSKDSDDYLFIYTGLTNRCRVYNEKTSSGVVFNKIPNFLFKLSMSNYEQIFYLEIPKEITINNIQYSHI